LKNTINISIFHPFPLQISSPKNLFLLSVCAIILKESALKKTPAYPTGEKTFPDPDGKHWLRWLKANKKAALIDLSSVYES